MDEAKKNELRRLRREFAERLSLLIGDRRNPENLKNFHELTGRPIPKLIQWRNPDHSNWPDMTSLLQMCQAADISPTWLLFGKGDRYLSAVSPLAFTVDEVVEILTDMLEHLPAQEAKQYEQKIYAIVKGYIDVPRRRKRKPKNVPPGNPGPVNDDPPGDSRSNSTRLRRAGGAKAAAPRTR